MKLGFYLGYAPPGTNPLELVALAQEAERLGFDSAWAAEAWGTDAVSVLAWLGAKTERIAIGSAIMQIPGRTPANTAMTAATLDLMSGGRFLLGVGVGHRAVNEPLGIDMSDPVATMRSVIGTLRAAWTKGPTQPRPAVPPRVLAAALAPRMIEVAGELADGVMFNLFPVTRYPRALAALRRGAARAGRDGATLEVCHFTTCYLADDGEAALHEARRMLARYANLPFYGNMLARSGFADEVEAIRAAWARRDVAAAERAVSDTLADAVTLVGDAARCRERLAAYRAAGATLTIVFPNPVGEPRAAAVARALAAFAPR